MIADAWDWTVAVALWPLGFVIDVWAFGFWRTVGETRGGQRIDAWFWDTFGWQPNGPPPKA